MHGFAFYTCILPTNVTRKTISGSVSDNNILGGNGTDILYGLAGSDIITGGNGIDRLYGGHGNDALIGGGSADLIIGGEGNDKIIPGNNSTTDYADGNKDIMFCGPGHDEFGIVKTEIQWKTAR